MAVAVESKFYSLASVPKPGWRSGFGLGFDLRVSAWRESKSSGREDLSQADLLSLQTQAFEFTLKQVPEPQPLWNLGWLPRAGGLNPEVRLSFHHRKINPDQKN